MKNILLLSLLLTSPLIFAAPEIHNPIQSLKQEIPSELRPIDLVKVKVFPHDGPYSTPQGVETRMDEAKAKSDGACRLTTPSEPNLVVAPGSIIDLKASAFIAGPGSLECDSPMTLIREGAQAISYRGSFTLHHLNGKLVVVNVVSFNDYLKGVVPAEMSWSWPIEALKAQAIAARTYAANQIQSSRRSNPEAILEVDDTIQYQAYRGFSVERPTTSEAVEATNEVYLLDEKGRTIIAYFSADSGGHTESAENVWGGKPLSYTTSKPEVYDLRLIKSAWTVNLTLDEMNAKLLGRGVVPKDFKLIRYEIEGFTKSGRIKNVRLFSESKMIEVAGERFRYGLLLRSMLFKVTETGLNTYKIDGLGWGHGVGMNQTGAKVLAESLGWDHKNILEFYYEGIKL